MSRPWPSFTFLMKSRDVLDVPDFAQHHEHRLVRAAVQRPVERRGRAGQRRVRIHLRAADRPHRVGAAVLLVVGVQREEHVEGAHQRRVRRVRRLRHPEHHLEEVRGVAQLVVRPDIRQPLAVAVRVGGDGRHLADQPEHLEVTVVDVADGLRFRIEGRQRADGAEEHAHRMRVVVEAVHELLDVLVDHRVQRDLLAPRLELARGSAARRTAAGTPLR
jgi:hypothetical protein